MGKKKTAQKNQIPIVDGERRRRARRVTAFRPGGGREEGSSGKKWRSEHKTTGKTKKSCPRGLASLGLRRANN